MLCHLCDDPAVAVFAFDFGCYCDSMVVQPLCAHHAHKSGPAGGGSMTLIKDLTVDQAFTRHWNRQDAIDELVAALPPQNELLEWARSHPPPQSWFDEDHDGL